MSGVTATERNKAYYAENRNRLVEYARAYRAANVEIVRERDRARYAANPAIKKAQSSDSAKRCADRKRSYNKEWRRKNADKARATAREYLAKIRKTPEKIIANRISCQMYDALRGRKLFRKSFELLGYSIDELKVHLERQFLKGMSWDNAGNWHIDHITPLSSFRIVDVEDPRIRIAWALSNLRPMWASDNIKKGAKRTFLI